MRDIVGPNDRLQRPDQENVIAELLALQLKKDDIYISSSYAGAEAASG